MKFSIGHSRRLGYSDEKSENIRLMISCEENEKAGRQLVQRLDCVGSDVANK